MGPRRAHRPSQSARNLRSAYGATAQRDGASGTTVHMTNIYVTPSKSLKRNFPAASRIRTDSGLGGDGEYRGGLSFPSRISRPATGCRSLSRRQDAICAQRSRRRHGRTQEAASLSIPMARMTSRCPPIAAWNLQQAKVFASKRREAEAMAIPPNASMKPERAIAEMDTSHNKKARLIEAGLCHPVFSFSREPIRRCRRLQAGNFTAFSRTA